MNQKKNPFRKPARPEQAEIPLAKPTSEMSDLELEEGLRKARRELLDLRHKELREREKARVAPEDAERTERLNLNSIFGKSNRRRFS
jgi:hypothetical protein